MPQDDRGRGADPDESLADQLGLAVRRPDHVAGPGAVPVSGTVEGDDPVFPGGAVEQAARLEVLDHAAVAMQQRQRRAGPPLDVMQPDAVDLQEPALRRVAPLGVLREPVVDQGRDGESRDPDDRGRGDRMLPAFTEDPVVAQAHAFEGAMHRSGFHLDAPVGSTSDRWGPTMLRCNTDANRRPSRRFPKGLVPPPGRLRREPPPEGQTTAPNS